jgi:flagellar biogenesis protein FliO
MPLLLAVALCAQAQQAPQPPAQPIPFKKDDGGGALALNTGLGFVVAVGLGIGALYLLRNQLLRRQVRSPRRMRVLETLRLAPKATLFLVEVDGRSLLLGQQGETLVVLGDASAPSPQADGGTSRA